MDALIVVQSAFESGSGLVSDGDSLHLNTYSGDDILSQFKDKAMARLGIDPTRAKYVKIRGPLDALDPGTLAPFLERELLRTDPVEKMSKIVIPRGGAGGGAYYFVVASPGAFECEPARTAPHSRFPLCAHGRRPALALPWCIGAGHARPMYAARAGDRRQGRAACCFACRPRRASSTCWDAR